MKSAVLVFPGINREQDMARALAALERRGAGEIGGGLDFGVGCDEYARPSGDELSPCPRDS